MPDNGPWITKTIIELEERVAELYDLIKYAQVDSGVCMCGDDIKDHNQSSGHPPVDVWDHAVEQVDQGETSEALILRKQAEAVQASRRAISSCSEIPNSSGHASRQAVSVPDAWCVVTNDDQIQYTAMVDKNLGLPIEQSHDYAWQQCNEVIQEWIELGLDAASKYVIRPIALLATPTKADDWIKCSDRLPAEYDGDLEGLVWVNDRDMTLPKYAQSRVHWSCVRGIAGYTHWMPTGFRRPQPPKQEGE